MTTCTTMKVCGKNNYFIHFKILCNYYCYYFLINTLMSKTLAYQNIKPIHVYNYILFER